MQEIKDNSWNNFFLNIADSRDWDYLPVVSTLKGLSEIATKSFFYLGNFEKKDFKESHHYFKNLNKKSFARCFVMSFPFIGNFAVGVYDLSQKKWKDREYVMKAPLRDFQYADKSLKRERDFVLKMFGRIENKVNISDFNFLLDNTSKKLLRDPDFILELLNRIEGCEYYQALFQHIDHSILTPEFRSILYNITYEASILNLSQQDEDRALTILLKLKNKDYIKNLLSEIKENINIDDTDTYLDKLTGIILKSKRINIEEFLTTIDKKHLLADKGFIRKASVYDLHILEHIDKKLASDEKFMVEIIDLSRLEISAIEKVLAIFKLDSNKNFMIELIKKDKRALALTHEDLLLDDDFMKQIESIYPDTIGYASVLKDIDCNEEEKESVRSVFLSLDFMDKLRSGKPIKLGDFHTSNHHAYEYAFAYYLNLKEQLNLKEPTYDTVLEFNLEAASMSFYFDIKDLPEEKQIKLIEINGLAISGAKENLRENKDLAIKAVKQNYLAYFALSTELQIDPEIKAAVDEHNKHSCEEMLQIQRERMERGYKPPTSYGTQPIEKPTGTSALGS